MAYGFATLAAALAMLVSMEEQSAQLTSRQAIVPPAQAEQDADPGTRVDDVVVIGQPLAEIVESFVDEVEGSVHDRGLARWAGEVCVGVVNLRTPAAQYIADRISTVARDTGLKAGEPGCRPNILIVAAADGQAMAQALVSSRPRMFRPGGSGMIQGSRALREFQNAETPVRWWPISVPTDSETGRIVVRLDDVRAAGMNINTYSGLRARIRDDLQRVIVIVDFEQASGANMAQLGDYLAMVSLAQIDAEAETRDYPTILNLFEDPTAHDGLTDWDLAYLGSLTGARNERILGHRIAAAITETLTSQTSAAGPSAPSLDAPISKDE